MIRSKAQRSALARKNCRVGLRVRRLKQRTIPIQETSESKGGRASVALQRAVYGCAWVNRAGIPRLNEARHQARINGAKASLRKRIEKKLAKQEPPKPTTCYQVTKTFARRYPTASQEQGTKMQLPITWVSQ